MCPAVDDGSVQEVMQPCSKLKKSRPVHVILKTDKWDYLGGQMKNVFFITFLPSGKVLAALGSGIRTCSFFLHSFSF